MEQGRRREQDRRREQSRRMEQGRRREPEQTMSSTIHRTIYVKFISDHNNYRVTGIVSFGEIPVQHHYLRLVKNDWVNTLFMVICFCYYL